MDLVLPDPSLPYLLPYKTGVVPAALEEGCELVAYLCEAGVWTCGWGETDGVTPTTRWTQEFADARFCDSLNERTKKVLEKCTVEPSPNQLAALTSFAYNYGGWATSSALKAHNRGDTEGCAAGMRLVNKVKVKTNGIVTYKVSKGLTARRAREAALYLTPETGPAKSPQDVAPEATLVKSPTAVLSGTGAVGLATAAASEVMDLVRTAGDQVSAVQPATSTIKSFAVETLGIPPAWFTPGALTIVAVMLAWIWWRRRQQRINGVA